jgi:hypothetical protein
VGLVSQTLVSGQGHQGVYVLHMIIGHTIGYNAWHNTKAKQVWINVTAYLELGNRFRSFVAAI